jgi:hypothetical protein
MSKNPLTTDYTVNGELVIDARKPLKFEVSDHDVKTGKALKSRECPGNNGVVRALKALHPELTNKEVRVHLSRTYIRTPAKVACEEFGAEGLPSTADNVWLRFSNPRELSEQVYKMDKQEDFTPGNYRLAPVRPPSAKIAAKKTKAAIPKKPRIKVARRMSQQRSLKGIRKFGINR